MKVQVVLRQVGEHGRVVAGARHPAEGQRVAGHLHRGRCHAALRHHREQRLQVRRLRRGQRALHPLGADPDLHPADQAGLVPGGPQPGFGQVAGGGLAAGPGHPDHGHLRARVAVDPAGDVAEPVPRRRHHERGHAGAGRPLPARGIGEDRDRAGRDRLVTVRRAVRPRAGQRRVQVARPHLAGVKGDSGQPARPVRDAVRSSHTQQLSQPRQRARRQVRGSDHAQRVSNISAH